MSDRIDPNRLKIELASKQSNLRYSTVIELLSQEAYEVRDVETLLRDAGSICSFVFEPYQDVPQLKPTTEGDQLPLFEPGGYL